MAEVWKEIDGFPAYYVSNKGRIRGMSGRILKPYPNIMHGYLQINLYRDKTPSTKRVNRLVAAAFLGDCPTPDHEAAHKDGVRSNNHASNLKWSTHQENCAERKNIGHCGEKNPRAKLTELQVKEILLSHERVSLLAKKYRISDSVIANIRAKRIWRHINIEQGNGYEQRI